MASKKKLIEELPAVIAQTPLDPVPTIAVPENSPETPPVAGKKWLTIAGVVGAVAIVGASVFYQHQQTLKQQMASKTAPEDEISQLVKDLSQLVVLPDNEQPVIATVVDLEKLKGQQFFQNAQLEDKVIIYAQAGKAILYRPAQKKVVEIAPFVNSAQDAHSSVLGANTDAAAMIKVEIRNGSGKGGQAALAKTKLSGLKNIEVIQLSNAAQIYADTQIVVLNNSAAAAVNQIQNFITGQDVTSLPQGEPASKADIVIILGKQ